MKLLYFSLVCPHLTYCITVWGNAADYLLNNLLLLQKKFVRLICKTNYLAHTHDLFKNLQLLTIHDLYEFYVDLYTFKVKNNLSPLNRINITFSHNQVYNLRRGNDIDFQYCRTSIRKKFIAFTAIEFWTALPPYLKLITSFSLFKKTTFNFLINRY